MVYLSVQQTRELDTRAINELGTPQATLMENAGKGVADYIIDNYPKEQFLKVIIVCGKGNNGGDGLVVARLLQKQGYSVKVLQVTNPEDIDFEKFDLIVDAIFGTGLSGEIKEPYKSVIKAMNATQKPIIAVDIPSGVNGDTGPISDTYIKAAVTITFVSKKLAMKEKKFKDIFGKIKVVDIGIPLHNIP